MSRRNVLWKMKQAMMKWGSSPEFWQEVKIILEKFEKEIRNEYSDL